MSAGLPEPFPRLDTVQDDDYNPAIRLFGKRFIVDQSELELLTELLAVTYCQKRLAGAPITTPLPAPELLTAWPEGAPLQYRPPVKLNLKVLALLGVSRVDSRHITHKQQYERVATKLQGRIENGIGHPRDTVAWIEELLQGFQGVGLNRTWCAQTFFPVTASLVTQETLWNETFERRNPVDDWYDAIGQLKSYFSLSRHRFMARGGELLYLQLCNALATAPATLKTFVQALRAQERNCLTAPEATPAWLHAQLQEGLQGLGSGYTAGLDRLVNLIEHLDPKTHNAVNLPADPNEGWLACEWCPRDSWREGYLFAVELNRVLHAQLGPVERLEALTMGCSLQVLRSLLAQSARYAGHPTTSGPQGYALVFTPQEGASRQLRELAHDNLWVAQGLIQEALQIEPLQENAKRGPVKPGPTKLYSEADTKYGHKLLLNMGKRLGIIVPKRGPGARLVMTDALLRYLVLALLRPGERCTLDAFLARVWAHYGIAMGGAYLGEAMAWGGRPPHEDLCRKAGEWLEPMLRASGFLTELSDACSVVRNTYGKPEQGAGGSA